MTSTVVSLDEARALAPLIDAHADAIESERQLPEAVVRALVGAGVFRLLVPRCFGGAEVDPVTACRVVEALGAADGSTGWCAMVGSTFGLFGGLLPEQAAREIYAAPHAFVAGAFRPSGIERAVPGGYRLSSRWSFWSGIGHCTWGFGSCRVFEGDEL